MTDAFADPIRPLAVDLIVFNANGELLLIERRDEPFAGHFALPGGMVDVGETVEEACCRELHEETGLTTTPQNVRLLGLYSNPARDPRRNVISAAYFVTLTGDTLRAGDDAASAAFYADWQQKRLAFDHSVIMQDATAYLNKQAA